jgi:hypothetical protein
MPKTCLDAQKAAYGPAIARYASPPESSTLFVVKSSNNSQQRDKKAASAGIYLDGIKGQ